MRSFLTFLRALRREERFTVMTLLRLAQIRIERRQGKIPPRKAWTRLQRYRPKGRVRVGTPIPMLASFAPLHGRVARIAWKNGPTIDVDLRPALISHRVFAAVLEDDAMFARGVVDRDEYGNCIQWDDPDAALSAVWIERLAKDQGKMP